MRLIHHTVSFDDKIIELILERFDETKVSYKIMTLLLSATRVRGLLNFLRVIESMIALIMYLPIPIISSFIIRYVNRLSGPIKTSK